MALKKIEIVGLKEKSPNSSKEKPTKVIKGNSVKQYLTAKLAFDNAEAIVKQLRPNVVTPGLELLFQHNIDHPFEPVSSVSIVDESGSEALVIFQDKYKTVDAKIVEAALTKLKVDINDCAVETVVASFDSSVFIVEGEFSVERYMVFEKAIRTAAETLGVPNPFASHKIVSPKENFHQTRWEMKNLKTIEAQKIVQSVLPATSMVKMVKIDTTIKETSVVAEVKKNPVVKVVV